MSPTLKSGRLALLGALALGIIPAGAQSLDDIYQKAKPEGAFTLYVGGPSAPWEARARTFEERIPASRFLLPVDSATSWTRTRPTTQRGQARGRCRNIPDAQ